MKRDKIEEKIIRYARTYWSINKQNTYINQEKSMKKLKKVNQDREIDFGINSASALTIPALDRTSDFIQEVPVSLVYEHLLDGEDRVVMKVGEYSVATLIMGKGLMLNTGLPSFMPAHFPFPVCENSKEEIIVFPEDEDNNIV